MKPDKQKIKELKIELIKKGQKVRELERRLKKERFYWNKYYYNKQWRKNDTQN
mgnify:CR=1 FL=1